MLKHDQTETNMVRRNQTETELVLSSLLGPVYTSVRALSGRLKFTVRRHKFNKESFSSHLSEAGDRRNHRRRRRAPPPHITHHQLRPSYKGVTRWGHSSVTHFGEKTSTVSLHT